MPHPRFNRRTNRARMVVALAMCLIGGAASRADEPVSAAANTPLSAETPRPIAPPQPSMLTGITLDSPVSSPATESRPIAPPQGSLSADAWQTGGALVAVLAVIFALRWIVRRLGDPLAARRPSGVVQVLSRFPLAKGQQIVIMEVGRRVLCLHQAGAAATTLCEFDDLTEIAELKARIEAGSSERQAFELQLTRSLERGPKDERAALDGRQPLNGTLVDLTRQPRRRARAGTAGVLA